MTRFLQKVNTREDDRFLLDFYLSSAHSQLLTLKLNNTRIFLFTSTSNSNLKLPDFMCADTVVHEEEDPSDGKSDYAFDQNALPSDLSTGFNTTGAYNQYYQEELALLSGFNITYNKRNSPPSLSSTTDSNEPSNQYKLITPMQKHTRSKSAAGNSSPLLFLADPLFNHTIIDRSKLAAGDSTSQLSLTSSAIIHSIIEKKMAETKKSEQWEESHENAGGSKPDEDDQYGQDSKKQRSAESHSMSRTGEKKEK